MEVRGEAVQPFEIVEPRGGESPLVVEVPHAGLWLDAETLAYTVAPARSFGRDADLYVDELTQDTPSEGATLIVARTSRYLVDLNRGENDYDGEAVEGGGKPPWPRGLVWRLTTDGDPVLATRLPRSELERRLDRFYRPYHAAVAALLERKRRRFGFAILLCAHSMPSQPRPQPIGAPPESLPKTPPSSARMRAAARARPGWSSTASMPMERPKAGR